MITPRAIQDLPKKSPISLFSCPPGRGGARHKKIISAYWNNGILEYWNIGITHSIVMRRIELDRVMSWREKGTIIMEPISIGPKAMLWGLHLQPVSEISATMILEYDHLFFLFIGGLFAIAYQNLSACSAFESGRFSKSTKVPKGQIFSQPYFSYIW